MAICGLVITLEGDGQESATLARLQAEPGVTVGEVPGGGLRIPAVLEAEGKAEYLERWRRLCKLAGVAHLDLAYVHYDDVDRVDHINDNDREPGE